jgi:hypothetical protein
MYQEVLEDVERQRKNHWQSIYNIMGSRTSDNHNVISEILHSYHEQNRVMERVYSKFARGLRVGSYDLKDDRSQKSSNRANLNFS